MNKKNWVISSLFLVLFIDGMGQGIFFPILTETVLNPFSHVFIIHTSTEYRNIIYGLVVGSFFLAWFFGAAILGDLSDSSGRKKTLLICLCGSAAGYFLSAISFPLHSVTLLIFGRLIDGFTAGSQPIAQAAIIDISDPQKKATNMALILMAVSLGIIGGPLIGGIFSDASLVSWFKPTTPLWFATLLAIVSILLLGFLFTETTSKTKKIRLQFSKAISIFISAFKNRNVKILSIVFLLLQFAWATVYTYMPIFLTKKFAATSEKITLFYVLLGLGLSIGFAYLTRKLESFVNKNATIAITYGLVACGILLFIISNHIIYIWIIILPMSIAAATGYSFLLALFSESTTPDKQGWVMGITGAMNAIVFGVQAIVTGVLAEVSLSLSLLLAISSAIFGILLILAKTTACKQN